MKIIPPLKLVAADVRRLKLFAAEDVRASSRRLLRFKGLIRGLFGVNLSLALLCAWLPLARAATFTPIPLWPDGAPGALGTTTNDIPSLTPYVPDGTNATRTAIVICPGGAYANVQPGEGHNYALWLNQHGVTCFVLYYRVSSHGYHNPAMLEDAARAVRWVRANAGAYNLNAHHVGIMGSSAGGHLAATLMTHFDPGNTNAADPVERLSSRPDFGILCYPVITLTGEFANLPCRDNLLGSNAPASTARLLSAELNVTYDTPPCFIWTTFADEGVAMENSLLFAEALRKNGVRFDLHIYERGRHGIGLGDTPPFAHLHPWTSDLVFWLREHKWAN
jgi:acetyl esterase/lipase